MSTTEPIGRFLFFTPNSLVVSEPISDWLVPSVAVLLPWVPFTIFSPFLYSLLWMLKPSIHSKRSYGLPFLFIFITRNSYKALPVRWPNKKSPSSLNFFSVDYYFCSGISSSIRSLFWGMKLWGYFFSSTAKFCPVTCFYRKRFELRTCIFVSKVMSSYFSVGLSVKIFGLISIKFVLRFKTLVLGSIKRSSRPNASYPPNLSISSLVIASLALPAL